MLTMVVTLNSCLSL